MAGQTVESALDAIYESLKNNNEDIDMHITNLKAALDAKGTSEVTVDTAKLAQSNRQGRKTMQAYFKKRGITVSFSEK